MSTATEDRLREARRRIALIEVRAQEGTAEARSRMQRYIDALHRDEESARASVRKGAEAVEERLEQLDGSLDLAENRVAAELAATKGEFSRALEAALHRWDANLDRLQTKAAAKTDVGRELAEETIADLRRRRLSIGARAGAVGTAAGDGWRTVKSHTLVLLDELKTKADTAWRN